MKYVVEYWFDFNHSSVSHTFHYETDNLDEDENEHILDENIRMEINDRILNFLEDAIGDEALNELGYIQENSLSGHMYYLDV
jgi:hypothetical protein